MARDVIALLKLLIITVGERLRGRPGGGGGKGRRDRWKRKMEKHGGGRERRKVVEVGR